MLNDEQLKEEIDGVLLDEIDWMMEDQGNVTNVLFNLCKQYARSVVPEEKKHWSEMENAKTKNKTVLEHKRRGFIHCRQQMLDAIGK